MAAEWKVKPSHCSASTINYIRRAIERYNFTPNPDKRVYNLTLGDPTVYGNLGPSEEMLDVVKESISDAGNHRYFPSMGLQSAREAITAYSATASSPLETKDIILASGCSHALDMCMGALCERDATLLIPSPGFPLYIALSHVYGVKTVPYRLLAERSWEVDLEDLESKIDDTTSAILVTNPSNPCGSVFTKQHILDIIAIAEKHHLPIIADEIYANMTFPGHPYYPVASLTDSVPVVSCNGLTKRFMVPGWRLGWIEIHDRKNRFGEEVRTALNNMATRLMGPNAPTQASVAKLLKLESEGFFANALKLFEEDAHIAHSLLSKCKHLNPIMPSGAMYMLVCVDMAAFNGQVKNDLEYAQKLMKTESVFVLPGSLFGRDDSFRLVLCMPSEDLKVAIARICSFTDALADGKLE